MLSIGLCSYVLVTGLARTGKSVSIHLVATEHLMFIFVCACLYKYICIYIYLYVCMYVCMYQQCNLYARHKSLCANDSLCSSYVVGVQCIFNHLEWICIRLVNICSYQNPSTLVCSSKNDINDMCGASTPCFSSSLSGFTIVRLCYTS